MFFRKAKPVFLRDRAQEMNLTVGFAATLGAAENVMLTIAGATLYQVFVNGVFRHYGPMRACHGMHRVETVPLGSLTERENAVVIVLTSYQCNSYSLPLQPAFLQAEVTADDKVIAYTDEGGDGESFRAYWMPERLQHTPRYSFQRNFTEVYALTPETAAFLRTPDRAGHERAALVRTEQKMLLPRDLYLPEFTFLPAEAVISRGRAEPGADYTPYRNAESYPGETFFCFPPEACELFLADDFRSYRYTDSWTGKASPEKAELAAEEYAIWQFDRERTGLISFCVCARGDCRLTVVFDEVLRDGKIDPTRLGCTSVAEFRLGAGTYVLNTAEPYSFRYLGFIAHGAGAQISKVGVRHVGYLPIDTKLNSADPEEQKIYAAAVESFRQNTYDIFMDCPSRERAGWLCDSFFTSRVEWELTGKSLVEHAFLDNFLRAQTFADIPNGMLPMCYPSDHTNHVYIPNWAMWYVLELYEYATVRHGDRELVERARERVMALVRFFDRFLNREGLLERLESWVFVEWSKANELVQEVNFPSNALYAALLDAVDGLYGAPELHTRAEHIRQYIREKALVGGFFCDNASRGEDGELHLSGACTEVCQYYMFFFGVANAGSHPQLWHTLATDFGPERAERGLYPEIYPANSFVGNYMRMEILFRAGLYDRLLQEIKGYFGYMADKTGTLWENVGDYASCNHGFASHVAVWLLRVRGKNKD